MNLETVRKDADKHYDICCKLGLNCSYLSVLNSMYETASEKKQYLKADLITTLIQEDINS